MSAIKKLFRQNLQWHRQQQGISQSALSEQCGYDRTYVGKIERGEKDPSLEAIIQLTRALDISIIEFFRSDRPETNQTVARSLKEGKDLYQIIFDGAYRMVGLIDTSGQFLELNRNFLEFTGRDQEELSDCKLWECEFWGDSPWRRQWLQNKVDEAASGEVINAEMKVHPPNEKSITTMEFTLTPVQNDQGNIEFIMVDVQHSQQPPSEPSLIRQLS